MMKSGQKIKLNKKSYPLYVGGSKEKNFLDRKEKGSSVVLEAQICADAFNARDVIWKADDPETVRLEEIENWAETDQVARKRVRALRTGITTVRAFLPNGDSAECIITVIDYYSRQTVSEIVLNTGELKLTIGDSAKLTAILYPEDLYGNGIRNDRLFWQSSAEDVAEVQNGTVTAIGEGKAVITAISADVGRTAACVITVKGKTAEGRTAVLQTKEEMVLYVGETVRLDGEGTGERVWISENRLIADVDETGLVTALSASLEQKVNDTGMWVEEVPKRIWVYATSPEGGDVVRYPVCVRLQQPPIHETVLDPQTLSLCVGEYSYVTASADTSLPVSGAVAWECSDENILQMERIRDTAYGTARVRITAKMPGDAMVTAVLQGKRSQCHVHVTGERVRVKSIVMEEEISIDVDQVFRFQPIVTEHVRNKRLLWFCTGDRTVTVDREGNVRGYVPGSCFVYAVAADSLSEEEQDKVQERFLNEPQNVKADWFPEKAVYAVCKVIVKDECPALRNLHVPEEAVTDHSVLLLWNRAALPDTGDFDHYRIYCDHRLAGKTKKLGFRLEKLKPDTAFSFQVEAVDRYGNVMCRKEIHAATKKNGDILNVLDFGAAGDGKRMDTFFLQKAVDSCPPGGTVLLPEGYVFLSGALFLKSDMTMQVDGILIGSADPKDYPRIITRWEGWRKLEQSAQLWENTTEKVPDNHCPHASLLNAGCYMEGNPGCAGPYPLHDLMICGRGQINANGFSLAYHEGANINTAKVITRDYPVKDATSRGSAIRLHNGRNIYLKDVQVAYAPGWTVHAIFCENLTFDGMEVISQGDGDCGQGADIFHCGHIFNGDGIDPDSCMHVNLFDILFTTGDDAVAIKSGRGREGNELDKPNGYIRVTDCSSVWSLGGFGTGSETAAGSHDLLFQNLTIKDILISGIWLKTNWSRGGVTENIIVRDVTAEKCNSPVWVFHGYSADRPQANPAECQPVVRNLVFENVHGAETNELGFRLEGTEECPVQNVLLRGVSSGGKENRFRFCENVTVIP